MGSGNGMAGGGDGDGGYERPTTAAAVASRPTSSWGFSSRVPPPDMDQGTAGQMNGKAPSGILDRPHTASAAVSARPQPGGGGGAGILLDTRGAAQAGQETDADGQVVASARALMRYRRTRTGTNGDGSVEKSWNSGEQQGNGNGVVAGAGAPRITVYQNPTKAPQVGQQAASAGGFLGSGWLTSDRPKSAGITTSGGIMSAFSGSRQQQQQGQLQAQTTQTGAGGGLSYGAIKNRFLASAAPAVAASSAKKSSSSKLFSLSR